jgi:hypothetical protein
MKHCTYLIVGGGMTADAAVSGIREVDEKGDICVVCDRSGSDLRKCPTDVDL